MTLLRKLTIPCALVALAAGAAGCGGSDDTESAGGKGAQTTGDTSDGGAPTAGTKKRKKGGQGKSDSGSPEARAPLAEGRPENEPQPQGIPADAPEYVGVFNTEVSASDAAKIGGGLGVPGAWTLIIGEKSSNLGNPKQTIAASVSVSGERITFKTISAPPPKGGKTSAAPQPCKGATGVYRYSLEDELLTFEAVKEGCAARRIALANSWDQVK